MTFRMENVDRLSLAEMKVFVENNRKLRFAAKTREVAHGIIEQVLKEQKYRQWPDSPSLLALQASMRIAEQKPGPSPTPISRPCQLTR
jgi:hypothetical protein